MEVPTLHCRNFILRPWCQEDAEALVRHANNPRIAGNLRDAFPHPYSLTDARSWLKAVSTDPSSVVLALEIDGEAAGGIGLTPMSDVYRLNGEVGYWLSEKHWGKGIMTEAVAALVEHAFTKTGLMRLFAGVFENNPSSMRVLEKNGFVRESVHKRAVIKEGIRMDEHYFALLREDWSPRS